MEVFRGYASLYQAVEPILLGSSGKAVLKTHHREVTLTGIDGQKKHHRKPFDLLVRWATPKRAEVSIESSTALFELFNAGQRNRDNVARYLGPLGSV